MDIKRRLCFPRNSARHGDAEDRSDVAKVPRCARRGKNGDIEVLGSKLLRVISQCEEQRT